MPSEGMRCPRCKRDGLVRMQHDNDDVFQCVYCDYRHDLTKATEPETLTIEQVIVSFLLVGLILLPLLGIVL